MEGITALLAKERLERVGMLDIGLCLAHSLHVGALQALAGATLQLQTLSRFIDENPRTADKKLRETHEPLAEEQRKLRRSIDKLKRKLEIRVPKRVPPSLTQLRLPSAAPNLRRARRTKINGRRR